MQFDFSGSTPIFRQVAQQLSESIAAGQIDEGERVPSTTEISTVYKVNPATVLKGMNLLVDQGLLEKRRGLGMFVATGARKRAQRVQARLLLDEELPALARQARLLGISLDELSKALERSYR
ncbi:GntR family transcriptional regulator [Bombiscardovia nodaiensis]|uniref:GntR family transcriptional regulator n=1 Tax=Bombiscardovia nodaiensis TaxID=2932181 RepID=A0ABN6SBZ4_9BIFI|nr:GntR family transcriptional regulator [Bombiscardovia nodaiensis]